MPAPTFPTPATKRAQGRQCGSVAPNFEAMAPDSVHNAQTGEKFSRLGIFFS